MIFRQLFDRETCTYTYLLADADSREAILIDPVREHFERDTRLLRELGLTLRYSLETHVHADHVTASGMLRAKLGSRSVLSSQAGTDCADILIGDGETIAFGQHTLEARHTPGHTSGCVSYVLAEGGRVFTGDTLLVRGCGRTDFQQGDPARLYASVHEKLFSLPDETLVYPGHDYKGRTCSTVGEEKAHNPRLGGGRSLEEFAMIMGNLKLSHPAQIHIAVPANMECGLLTVDSPTTSATSDWAEIRRTASGIPEVSTAWVAENHGKDAFRLVDVRQSAEYFGPLGHIDDTELVPLANLEAVAAGWAREEPVVVLCRSGGRSGRAASTLENLGFTRVASMAGGMNDWSTEGRPTA
ncbi:MAG: sulfur dioxygenase [Myxococcota bacterium]|jgi:sulfur dioxygenase